VPDAVGHQQGNRQQRRQHRQLGARLAAVRRRQHPARLLARGARFDPAGQQLPAILGDVASSKPAYQRDPRKGYTAAGYSDYKDTNKARAATVFVGANDGLLHAFNAANGAELWAYAPRITMKKLYRQTSTTYGTNHQYTVDGTPEVADVKINNVWRSVLVSGLNAGGRGYFALDVTDPANPRALWELCADASVCASANYDADIGLSFGNPQIGTWKDAAAPSAGWCS
jgi:type IV pilus assembly protein PilY1